MEEKRYTEVTDDSSHHYIIPVDRLDHWYKVWMNSDEYELGHTPDYATYVDGGRLTFTDPKLGDINVD
jgi:hypothetical protein